VAAATVDVNDMVEDDVGPSIGWGWILAAGIAWVFIGLWVLSARPTAIAVIAFYVAGVVILAGVAELVNAFMAEGWKWLHAAAGVIFLIVGILAFLTPFRTFLGLALLFGWYLIIKGTVDIVISLALRGSGVPWGLGLAAGIIMILLGIYAIGNPGISAWLLVLWVGIGAITHGIVDIFRAFQVRSLEPA
jgi:uncharacterized membrane protein HdeD (DUF308 family)